MACWHPFTQAKTAGPPIPIISGKGVYLFSETKSYLDAISSWWVNLHGHAESYIAEKIALQAKELEQVIFAGYTHPQATIFAKRLLSLFSDEYAYLFFSDNGSTAVEVALKMALQIQGKGEVLSFQNGYHGDTFGAMAVGKSSSYHRPFWPYLFKVHSIAPPIIEKEEESWNEFIKIVSSGQISVFIFEPLIQGAGGMVPHSKLILAKMIKKCRELNIITIADEVMTGFGRTGPLFTVNDLGIYPDLLAVAKGITGGFLPMGATLAKKFIYESFYSDDFNKAFLHGHSYTANPLACAAANASLDLLLKPSCTSARKMIESEHKKFQKKWQNHPKIVRFDVLGTILALEYKKISRQELIEFFHEQGILIRPLGNVLYLMPPYCITFEELQKIYAAIIITLEIL